MNAYSFRVRHAHAVRHSQYPAQLYPCIVEILSLHGEYGPHLMPMPLFGGFVVYETFLYVIPSPIVVVGTIARFIGIEPDLFS